MATAQTQSQQGYQIKSTPFFRRIVSTSKKNGELQKLKEEYERIKEFNDRTIEIKMRQVRLKRLFREIEVIKEFAMSPEQIAKRRKMQEAMQQFKTEEQIRLETYRKARELGKEYSRVNGYLPCRYLCTKSQLLQMDANNISRQMAKNSLQKRQEYGNESSAKNREQRTHVLRRSANYSIRDSASASHVANANAKETLKKRIQYGNDWNSINMNRLSKRSLLQHYDRRNKSQADIRQSTSTSQRSDTLSLQRKSKPFEYLNEYLSCQSCLKDMENSDTLLNRLLDKDLPTQVHCNNSRASKLWHKLSLLVHYRLDKAIAKKTEDFIRSLHDGLKIKISQRSQLETIPSESAFEEQVYQSYDLKASKSLTEVQQAATSSQTLTIEQLNEQHFNNDNENGDNTCSDDNEENEVIVQIQKLNEDYSSLRGDETASECSFKSASPVPVGMPSTDEEDTLVNLREADSSTTITHLHVDSSATPKYDITYKKHSSQPDREVCQKEIENYFSFQHLRGIFEHQK